MSKKIYRIRKSKTAKRLLVLPIRLTYVTMTVVEFSSLKDRIFDALVSSTPTDLVVTEQFEVVTGEGDPDAA